MGYSCNKEIFGGIDIINSIVSEILYDIQPVINDEDVYFDVRLILNELLINCHEHGNKNDIRKKIKINLKVDNKDVVIKVQDEGDGIKDRRLYDPNEFKENGRGLMLVEALADKVSYNKNIIECMIEMTP